MATLAASSRSRSSSSSKSSSSKSCTSCSSSRSSSSSGSSTNSKSSFTSSSSSYSSSSSSSSSSQSSLADGNCGKAKKCVKRLLHSQSCHDICRERRAFEDDEDTKPLLDGEGRVNSATMKNYFSSSKKHTHSERSCHRQSRKGNSQKKRGLTDNVRKAKSMEVLSIKPDQQREEFLDDEATKRRKEETKEKILKDKAKFSAFLNEITRQLFSPSKLQTLGVANVTGAVSPIASPAKSSDSETKENKRSNHSSRLSRDVNSVTSCSPCHTCKQSSEHKNSSQNSNKHHRHKVTKMNSTHLHHREGVKTFSSTGLSECHCPKVEQGHRRHKKHPIQTSSHETDGNTKNRKRNTVRHQSPSPIPHQHSHHDQHHNHHCHSSGHHHCHHQHKSKKRKPPHHDSHTHHDNPHLETCLHHSHSKSQSPQPRSHHSPSPNQHQPRLDPFAHSDSYHQSPSLSSHPQHDDHRRCPTTQHHFPKSKTIHHSHSESDRHSPSRQHTHSDRQSCTCSTSPLHQHQQPHGNQISPLNCQHQGDKESHHSAFNANQQNLPILNSQLTKSHYSSLPDVHDSFSHQSKSHLSDHHFTQDHHHYPNFYDSHYHDNANLHHSSSEHHLPHPHHHSHHHSIYSGVSTHCEPTISKSSSSEAEKQHLSCSDHHNPHHRQSQSGKSKILEHPKSHHHTHHLDTQFDSEGQHHHSQPSYVNHANSQHLQVHQYHSHSKSDLQPNREFAHSPNSLESHKTLHTESHLHHHKHPEVHQHSYSKSKTQNDVKLTPHFSSDSHIYSHPECHNKIFHEPNLQYKHSESDHHSKHLEAHASFPSESLHPFNKESHADACLQPIRCLDCLESHQFHSHAKENYHQGDNPNLRHSPVGQQAVSPCSSKSDSSRNSASPTRHDDHSTVKNKVMPVFQDALVKSDNPFKPFIQSVAPPPVQFMDREIYKGSMTVDDQLLGPLPEEGESDWSEMGEEGKHCTMSSLESGHHRSHCPQNHGWWMKADQFRRGDGDTESESGGEELTKGHSLQVPHFQFTLHSESKPVTSLNSTGPADGGYQMSTGRQLCSSIRILSASLEEINSAGMPQFDHLGQLLPTTDLMDIYDSRGSSAQDCTKNVGHDWTKADGAKGAGRRGQETLGSMANLESAQKMLNHFIQEGERTQL